MCSSDLQVVVPAHFYGQLSETAEGIKLLSSEGVFKWLVTHLTSSAINITEKRAALWALGCIGSTSLGFKTLIMEQKILHMIIHLAETCPCLSVRGYGISHLFLC